MAIFAALCSLATVITWTWLLARYVSGRSKGVSRSTPREKAPESPELAEIRRQLESLQADQVGLSSNLEKVCTTAKRLTARAGMREHRESMGSSSPPPIGTPKAELLRHYGMSGKVGPEFARAQQELELQLEQKRRTN